MCSHMLHLTPHNSDLPYAWQQFEWTVVVVESNILEFHLYKDVWTPVTGEVLTCEMEDE